ncbi:AlpA family phage regulatory protein [Paraburkholderia sp. 31.1]|uniref:helix-turn-helix transcriptional regulator n=1 Tax=Paraburkholderia sp. 31.1 TaxID=2615205 RepID=UPI0016564DE2|nr:AlpA family phage regulatory protein [Paraburkholderia sp. 31.1]MBC8725282.1 AlpA family phage regulatory protein [Paraburkholderia sp. 31.1]
MNERLLRRAEVEQRIGLTGSTIYLKIAQGKFPKPIKVGVAAVRWRESEVNRWIAGHPPDPHRAGLFLPARCARSDRSHTSDVC